MHKNALTGILLIVTLVTLVLVGCGASSIANDGNNSSSRIVPLPDDIYHYKTSIVLGDGRLGKTTFALLEGKVNIDFFCAGCYGQYYITFWHIPDQTDRYIGDKLEGDRTTDTAILSKPLYKYPGQKYLDNIWSIVCTDKKGNPIEIAESHKPYPVSYNPTTRELLIDGFRPNHQTYFSITYFHSLPKYFKVHYSPPGKDTEEGYVYDPRAIDWVTIPPGQQLQVVPPFTIRHVPVILKIPSDVKIDSGYKFEFYVTVREIVRGNATAVQTLIAYNQRWLVSCR